MACGHDDSTINIVVVLLLLFIIIIRQALPVLSPSFLLSMFCEFPQRPV